MSIDACQHCEGSMFYAKPSRVASSCVDTATLSLPAPSAPHQGDGAPNSAWNDEMIAEVAQATVAPGGAWRSNHPADDIQQREDEQADSEQTADESSIEAPTTAPVHSWVKPLAVWAPGGSRSAVRQCNAGSALAAEGGATGVAIAMRPDKRPEKRGVVLVTAELMGDPNPDHVRTELRQDERQQRPGSPAGQGREVNLLDAPRKAAPSFAGGGAPKVEGSAWRKMALASGLKPVGGVKMDRGALPCANTQA
jgi:hypothetical protein